MTTAVAEGDVERFRVVLAHALGLRFEDSEAGHLADVLRRRMDVTSRSGPAYLDRIEHEHPDDELAALAVELTTPESYFFRSRPQFDALAHHALLVRSGADSATGRLRILCAGCATGEEPYSAAMVLAEVGIYPEAIDILAVDINPVALARARRGRYTAWSLRDTAVETQHRWFQVKGDTAVLDERVRDAVRIERRNLADPRPDPLVWAPAIYDAVFCRNVLMYLTPVVAQAIIARIAGSLVPGGLLFLGHAESLRGLSTAFDLCHDDATFYYRRTTEISGRHAPERARPGGEPLIDLVEEAGTWIDAISLSTQRVHDLTTASHVGRAVPATLPATLPAEPAWDLTGALGLLHQDRLDEALSLVEGLPPAAETDPDALLLRAVLLTQGGAGHEAEETCQGLLAIDPLNAGAHYLLALCREAAGDIDAAADRDRVAVHLDRDFAMPRVHLGLLARRAGNPDATRAELEHAITALQHEDASRLLLFGGGFSREALTALCRAELAAVGAEP